MYLRRMNLMLLGLVAIVFSLSSCLPEAEGYDFEVGYVAAVNAVPGSTGYNIGLDNNQINNLSLGQQFEYGDLLGYVTAVAGNRLVRVFERGSGASPNPVIQETIQLAQDSAYTLFVTGTEDDVDLVVSTDDMGAPSTGKAKVRFIHLSPDAASLGLRIKGGDVLATNQAFRTVAEFVEIDPADPHTFEIVEHVSGTVLHEFTLPISATRIYTIYAKGLLSEEPSSASAFGHGSFRF